MMDIRPIRTEADYDWALAEITPYFENQPAPGTPEADRFDVLATLIGAYENEHWNIAAPDPVEAIKEHMVTFDKTQGDLAELLGSKSRASEVLGKRRRLTLEMVHLISTHWHVPAEIMIKPYHLIEAKQPASSGLHLKKGAPRKGQDRPSAATSKKKATGKEPAPAVVSRKGAAGKAQM